MSDKFEQGRDLQEGQAYMGEKGILNKCEQLLFRFIILSRQMPKQFEFLLLHSLKDSFFCIHSPANSSVPISLASSYSISSNQIIHFDCRNLPLNLCINCSYLAIIKKQKQIPQAICLLYFLDIVLSEIWNSRILGAFGLLISKFTLFVYC